MKKLISVLTICVLVNIAFAQNFGIGQPSPSEKLDVAGYIKTSQGIKFPDGTVQTSAASNKHIIWSGYCNFHGSAAGWNVYCNNSTDFNSASGYISPNGSGTFTIQKSGYYSVRYWGIALQQYYAHVYWVVNGTLRHYGHEYVGHGAWGDNFMDWTWPFNAGETFYIQVYNGGSYAFHSGNPFGQYSRIQVAFEGEL